MAPSITVGVGGSARIGSTVLEPGDVATVRDGRIDIRHPATAWWRLPGGGPPSVAPASPAPTRKPVSVVAPTATPTAARPTPAATTAARDAHTGRVRGHRLATPGTTPTATPAIRRPRLRRAPARERPRRGHLDRDRAGPTLCPRRHPFPQRACPGSRVPRLARARRVPRAAPDAAPLPRARWRGRDAPHGRRPSPRRVRAPAQQHRRRQDPGRGRDDRLRRRLDARLAADADAGAAVELHTGVAFAVARRVPRHLTDVRPARSPARCRIGRHGPRARDRIRRCVRRARGVARRAARRDPDHRGHRRRVPAPRVHRGALARDDRVPRARARPAAAP